MKWQLFFLAKLNVLYFHVRVGFVSFYFFHDYFLYHGIGKNNSISDLKTMIRCSCSLLEDTKLEMQIMFNNCQNPR